MLVTVVTYTSGHFLCRRRDEYWANFKMKMERIETACDVADLLCLSFFMGLIVHMHMQ